MRVGTCFSGCTFARNRATSTLANSMKSSINLLASFMRFTTTFSGRPASSNWNRTSSVLKSMPPRLKRLARSFWAKSPNTFNSSARSPFPVSKRCCASS